MRAAVEQRLGALRLDQGSLPEDPVHRLERLGATQHAVLLAAIAGVPLETIAARLAVAPDDVASALADAASSLEEPSVEVALRRWQPVVDALDDDAFRIVFGVSKHWWEPPAGAEPAAT